MTMTFIPLLGAVDLQLHSFSVDYSFVFYITMMTLVLAVLLKSVKIMLAEVVFFAIFFIIDIPVIYVLLTALQILLTLFVLYRLKQAIDYNYMLILEKTHQIPRKITSSGDNGHRSTFL